MAADRARARVRGPAIAHRLAAVQHARRATKKSALAAAHYGAAVAAFFKQEADDSPTAAPAEADIPDEITPGMTAMLPPGVDIANWSPNYPDGEMPAFNKAMLRGGAAGLGVSYAGLTSDMEGANFSSLRDGRGEERDEWRMFQRDLDRDVARRGFPPLAGPGALSAALGLPIVEAREIRGGDMAAEVLA